MSACREPPSGAPSPEDAGVQQAGRIELGFQGPKLIELPGRVLQAKQLFFQLANAVLTGHASPKGHRGAGKSCHGLTRPNKLSRVAREDVDVKMRVSDVAENGALQSGVIQD